MSDNDEIIRIWIERELGPVTRLQRQPRWRPVWFATLGGLGEVVVRGDRSDIFAEETLAKMGEVMLECTTETISNAGHLVQGDNPVDFITAARTLLSKVNA